MVPQELAKSDIVKIIEQLGKLLPSNFVNRQVRGRRKAYSDKSILKLSILLKLCDVSYRGQRRQKAGNMEERSYEFRCTKPKVAKVSTYAFRVNRMKERKTGH